MAYSYEDIIRSQYEAKAAERAQALADLEAARLNENPTDTMAAADRIVEIDKSVGALDRIANQFVASQQAQPQGNRWNLSNEEVEVAKASHSAGTPDERIEEYARNKQRYRQMRQSGAYRDDQGTVSR
jgi:hypothetical protein